MWACKSHDILPTDFELLIYLDAIDFFTKHDFKQGTFTFSWDNRRWNRLLKEGWIVVWRKRNRTTQKYNIYKVSFKCKQLISRMYRIMLGEEDIPTYKKKERYSDKMLAYSILNTNKDKTR
ncbi:MAG: hypothetical protein GY777_23105 [Candidatus Brocadiaceae bacterium]|nr:hypothetical protein [Candidatus Brocadiaceae bacterium]